MDLSSRLKAADSQVKKAKKPLKMQGADREGDKLGKDAVAGFQV